MICFIHIERAGGTTLHYIFRNNYLSYITLTPWRNRADDPQRYFTVNEYKLLSRILPFTKGIGGHTTRCYLNYEKKNEINYITFLRDPIARYYSHFNYQKEVMKKNMHFYEFLNKSNYDNYMTRRIAGKANLEKAKTYLRDKFKFVGFIDNFDESLVLMRNELKIRNFKIFYERRNPSPDPNYLKKDQFNREEIRQVVQKKNEMDIELYEYARDELFEKYRNNFKGNIQTEIQILENANKAFKFSILKQVVCTGYRWLIYRNLEYLLLRNRQHCAYRIAQPDSKNQTHRLL